MMGTAKHVGRVGAPAVVSGIRNVRRYAMRVTASVGVAALMMTAAASVPVSTESPAVKLTADSTALLVCGTACPKWNDAHVEVIMDRFITPIYPDQTITPVAVTTPNEAWPVTLLFRLLGFAFGDPSIGGPGGEMWPDVPWWKLSGLFDLTGNQSIEAGVVDLEEAMADHPSDHLVIYGYSLGAVIAVKEKRKLAEQYPAGTTAPDIDFVLSGDVGVPNGGFGARFPGLYIPILDWSYEGAHPTDTQFDTTVITRQYDGFADFPLYPLNIIADLNAVLGLLYVHTWPFDVSVAPDASTSAYQGTHGDSSYYFFETENLPLFAPLRMLGVPEPVVDVVEPFFRVLVELGYDRSIAPWEPTPARLIPTLDPAKVITDLGNAIGEGIDNALALVGLPPGLRTPAPVTVAAPPAEDVQTEVAQPGISHRMTSTIPSHTEQLTSQETATVTATRTDGPTQTEQFDSTEPATENGRESTNTAPSTNEVAATSEEGGLSKGQKVVGVPSASAVASTHEGGKRNLRSETPGPVVRDSLGATERPRGFSHRNNGRATSTTVAPAADRPTTEGSSSSVSSGPAASSSADSNSSSKSSAGDSAGGDVGGSD